MLSDMARNSLQNEDSSRPLRRRTQVARSAYAEKESPSKGARVSATNNLLEQLEPAPAFVLNHLADLLAWTEGYDRLARPLGIFDAAEPNLLWFTFTDVRARSAYPDWDDIADEQVDNLRMESRGAESDARALADRLEGAAGSEFSTRWERGGVARKRTGIKAIAHPAVGVLRLAFETLALPDADRQRLVVYLPADTATAAGLDQLAGRRPGALRSVSVG